MLLTTAAFILALSGDEPPVMRVPAAGLRLSEPAHAEIFARRLADQSRSFCAAHIEFLTPDHVGNPRLCERGMALEAVRAMSAQRRADFRQAGGRRMLARMQR